MIKWNSKNVGRCLTEYIREDYQEVADRCGSFFTKSQFDQDYHGKSFYDFQMETTQDPPRLSYGSILYGIDQEGEIHKLKSIIDSSD